MNSRNELDGLSAVAVGLVMLANAFFNHNKVVMSA